MKASLFITCVADVMYAHVGESAVKVLRSLGVELDFPKDQTCCGQPGYNSGYFAETKRSAKQMIKTFQDSEYVIFMSGSCAAMIRETYLDLLKDEPEWLDRAHQLAEKTYEFSEFLVKVLKKTDLGAKLNARATYHHSCHMTRHLQVTEEPISLLANVQGLDFVEIPYKGDCCGFGGTFSIKMPEISEAMVHEKTEHVRETAADILVGSDMACLMNIKGRLNRNGQDVRVMHVAEVLAEGCGLI